MRQSLWSSLLSSASNNHHTQVHPKRGRSSLCFASLDDVTMYGLSALTSKYYGVETKSVSALNDDKQHEKYGPWVTHAIMTGIVRYHKSSFSSNEEVVVRQVSWILDGWKPKVKLTFNSISSRSAFLSAWQSTLQAAAYYEQTDDDALIKCRPFFGVDAPDIQMNELVMPYVTPQIMKHMEDYLSALPGGGAFTEHGDIRGHFEWQAWSWLGPRWRPFQWHQVPPAYWTDIIVHDGNNYTEGLIRLTKASFTEPTAALVMSSCSTTPLPSDPINVMPWAVVKSDEYASRCLIVGFCDLASDDLLDKHVAFGDDHYTSWKTRVWEIWPSDALRRDGWHDDISLLDDDNYSSNNTQWCINLVAPHWLKQEGNNHRIALVRYGNLRIILSQSFKIGQLMIGDLLSQCHIGSNRIWHFQQSTMLKSWMSSQPWVFDTLQVPHHRQVVANTFPSKHTTKVGDAKPTEHADMMATIDARDWFRHMYAKSPAYTLEGFAEYAGLSHQEDKLANLHSRWSSILNNQHQAQTWLPLQFARLLCRLLRHGNHPSFVREMSRLMRLDEGQVTTASRPTLFWSLLSHQVDEYNHSSQLHGLPNSKPYIINNPCNQWMGEANASLGRLRGGSVFSSPGALRVDETATSAIVLFDFASHYPRLIIGGNLCPSTLVVGVSDNQGDAPDYSSTTSNREDMIMPELAIMPWSSPRRRTLNEYYCSTEVVGDDIQIRSTPALTFEQKSAHEGFLPRVVRRLLDWRAQVKQDLTHALHHNNTSEMMRLAARESVLKVATNAIFGVCEFLCPPIAHAITSLGRHALHLACIISLRRINGGGAAAPLSVENIRSMLKHSSKHFDDWTRPPCERGFGGGNRKQQRVAAFIPCADTDGWHLTIPKSHLMPGEKTLSDVIIDIRDTVNAAMVQYANLGECRVTVDAVYESFIKLGGDKQYVGKPIGYFDGKKLERKSCPPIIKSTGASSRSTPFWIGHITMRLVETQLMIPDVKYQLPLDGATTTTTSSQCNVAKPELDALEIELNTIARLASLPLCEWTKDQLNSTLYWFVWSQQRHHISFGSKESSIVNSPVALAIQLAERFNMYQRHKASSSATANDGTMMTEHVCPWSLHDWVPLVSIVFNNQSGFITLDCLRRVVTREAPLAITAPLKHMMIDWSWYVARWTSQMETLLPLLIQQEKCVSHDGATFKPVTMEEEEDDNPFAVATSQRTQRIWSSFAIIKDVVMAEYTAGVLDHKRRRMLSQQNV